MKEKKNAILVVDDEAEIRRILSIFLDAADFKVAESENAKQGIRMMASMKPDLVILDLGLPDMDGKDVIKTVREWTQVPIIILSVRSEDDEIVAALNLGADDYMTKPFDTEVLLARIYANLRKRAVRETGEIVATNGPIRMDLVRHEVFIGDKKIAFTPKEYDLLHYFLINRGRMLTHKQILKHVWGSAHVEDTQYLRVYIAQVRDKLGKISGLNKLIVAESGIGYRMDIMGELPDVDDH